MFADFIDLDKGFLPPFKLYILSFISQVGFLGSTFLSFGASTTGVSTTGTSSVYDQQLGKNLTRPFLHVRYRASQTDDRRMKSWVTGSVGAATSALDAMQVHMLSERCLVVQGANNFMLMK